jgi:transposase-like protein
MTNLTDPMFHDEDKARAYFEAMRWPDGPYCPHCGNSDQERIVKLKGKSHRPGLYQCNECRGHFSVTVGSVMERSKIPLTKWAAAFHLMAASKKGVSAHQLMRMLGIGSYRTAWFLAHRVREAMMMPAASRGPIGGEGKTVEADETYFGKAENPRPSDQRKGRPYKFAKKAEHKRPIVALVERGGEVRMMHVEDCTAAELREILFRNVSRKSHLHTDESRLYTVTGEHYASHRTVKHSAGEYVRYEDIIVHTNTVENVFSVLKRGMRGVYQHCGEAHLHRYLAEFEFRYNNRSKLGIEDAERAARAVKGAAGKRLTYHQSREASHD